MITYADLPKPFFALAPMDEVTETVFRQIVNGCAAPDMAFTEFVNVDGLMSVGRPRLLKKLQFAASEKRLVAQLWGLNPENFKAVAAQIADGSLAKELGLPEGCNFVGVDLNMGCPAKSEVSHGACSALINDRPLAEAIIKATQAGVARRLPVSVKTRVGFHEVDMTWFEFLLQHELDMLVVHGRTRKQMSKVPADWNLIGAVREMRDAMAVPTLIVGNGDVLSRQQGLDLAQEHKLDGIMIGRGIFHDPYIFAQQSPWESVTALAKLDLYRQQVELFAATWQNRERPINTLNKFCKIYVNGFEGAKEMREELMAATSTDELLSLLSAQVENVTALSNTSR
jgi:tRNA-dihydrouridine synthase